MNGKARSEFRAELEKPDTLSFYQIVEAFLLLFKNNFIVLKILIFSLSFIIIIPLAAAKFSSHQKNLF